MNTKGEKYIKKENKKAKPSQIQIKGQK